MNSFFPLKWLDLPAPTLLLIQRFLNVKANVMCVIYLGALHLLLKGGCGAKAWPVRTLNTLGHADWF